ncbi:hypothetical protein CI109_106942 [Kwoniella shandongensis]|uniref:Proteasome assembly chaperone 2 n=1 Tax=Kwoniella shandongensis TaxID=1734106 RepID=A0A5M6C668_9TREE|nr:uncharacterized protein CI109_000804 [Kwoniella shandongensis]KAA5530624.1 hypothetical protein CI109_000804 [Kwoniella shandongensis]
MTNFYAAQGFDPVSFKSSTLILPAVSLGNVPQLTADLLISSLGLRRVGWIGRGDTVAPFSGAGEGGEIVTGGLEVYGQPGSELYVVQQRSPTLKTKKDAHVALLHDFISTNAFSSVVILTSLDAANQDDAQLLTPHQRVLPPRIPSSLPPSLQRLSDLLPPLSLNMIDQPRPSASTSSTYPPFLPAAGLTRRLLASLASEQIPHGAVTAWCVEGDNRGDAVALAGIVLRLLGIENDVQLQEPSSWEGLFGTTEGWSGGMGADSELYG